MAEETGDSAQEQQQQTTQCPNCGHEQLVEPVTVIRKEDKEFLDALFKGTLNTHQCTYCNRMFVLEVPVLYRDDEAMCLIYYMPLESKKQRQTAEEKMDEFTGEIFDEAEMSAAQYRLTVTRRGFMEKIAIHQAGLDDRFVEYFKYQLINQRKEDLDPVRRELLYDFSNKESDKIAFLVYDRETGEAEAGAHVEREVYDETAEMFKPGSSLYEELKTLFPGAYVSVDRILEEQDE